MSCGSSWREDINTVVQLNGFIKIHRKLVRWGWYTDNVVKCLFLHLLLTANFKENEWMGRVLKPGQLVTSYPALARDLKFSVQQIRTALAKLKSTGEVTCESTNKYTLITVVNWEEYQTFEEVATDQKTHRKPAKQQTNNSQATGQQQQRKNKRKQEEKKNNSGCAAFAPSGPPEETEEERRRRIAELRR